MKKRTTGLLSLVLAAGLALASPTPADLPEDARSGETAPTPDGDTADAAPDDRSREAGSDRQDPETPADRDAPEAGPETQVPETQPATDTQAEDTKARDAQATGTRTPDKKKSGDKLISGMSVLGNQEAPKSLVIVPWKSSEVGDSLGISTMLDDSRQPIDRDVFMRELSYYQIRSSETP